MTLADFRGKVVAVTFIFTMCTDTCPVLTPMMSFVQDRLGADFGSKIAFVSITVDPERDTPEVLKEYAQAFGANLAGWCFLTGSPSAIRGRHAPLRRVRGEGRRTAMWTTPSSPRSSIGAAFCASSISECASTRGVPARSLEPRERIAMMRIVSALVGLVARVPARVQIKLLAAFLAIARC